MPKITYVEKNFRAATLKLIEQSNEIIVEYQEQGFDLTLRQLYYQFVARGLLDNTVKNYGKLGTAINDGRLAGLIDWDAIVDRTRKVEEPNTWRDPEEILEVCVRDFKLDLWSTQTYRPEVWIEKEALKGVIAPVCERLRVPYFACKGYNSQSAMWRAGRRMLKHRDNKQRPVILHLGDHDASGIDMTRDILDRMAIFTGSLHVERLALNMDQVEKYNPPKNPAKLSDPRAADYISEFGTSTWELDALDPPKIVALIEEAVLELRDDDLWNARVAEEDRHREQLSDVCENWEEVVQYIDELKERE